MKKKVSITAANGRRRSDFLSRLGDIFEHKFDGFPANVPKGIRMPGRTSSDIGMDIDLEQILKDLQNESVQPTTGAVPCPDGDPVDCTICWEFPIELTIKFRMKRDDTDDSSVVQLMISEDPTAVGGDNNAFIYLNFQGADPTTTMYMDLGGEAYNTSYTSFSNAAQFGSANNVWCWAKIRVEDAFIRGKVWVDGLSEPGWLGTIGGPTMNLSVLRIVSLLVQPGEVGAPHIEIDTLVVTGYDGQTYTETFNRTESNGWGTSEILAKEWITETTSFVEVDGSKARFTEPGGSMLGLIEILCEDCSDFESGQTITEVLSSLGGDDYQFSHPFRYVLQVWFDGIPQLPDVDYTLNGTDVLSTTESLPGETEVRARYVVL